jgi:hypothetical protein
VPFEQGPERCLIAGREPLGERRVRAQTQQSSRDRPVWARSDGSRWFD